MGRKRCLSMLRARREQPSADAVDAVSDNLLNEIEHREDLRALLADVTKLPDDQREALVLAEVGDLSHSDISRILGCEVSKVKSLVFQARTALIDRRTARETPCAEIREQLATLRGGALRRSHLRHHLEACPGCSEYREQVRRQRAMLAVALPVVPSLALRAKVLGSVGLGGSTAAAAGGGAAATAAGGFGAAAPAALAKLGLVAVLAAGGAGTAAVAGHGGIPLLHQSAPASQSSRAHDGAATGKRAADPAATAAGATAAGTYVHKAATSRRSANGSAHGFTPVLRQSNGEQARAFAKTRGKGQQTSTAHRHVTAQTRAHPVPRVHVKHVAAPNKAVARPAPVHTQALPAPKAEQPATTTTPATTTAPASTPTQPAPRGKQHSPSLGGKTLDSTSTP